LQHQHAERLTKDLGRVFVVGITNVGDRDEQLKGVLIVGLSDASLDVALDLGFSLLAVPALSACQP
jgi:hypothetical protein